MILGIGTDLVDISRMRQLHDSQGETLLERLLTEAEREQATSQADPVPRLAKYFAAKEACIKALVTPKEHGISWQDIAVGYAPGSKQPVLSLSGKAAGYLPDGARLHLSLSDEREQTLAFVIIESAD